MLLPIFGAVLAIFYFGLGLVAFIVLLGLLIYAMFFSEYDWVCPKCGAVQEAASRSNGKSSKNGSGLKQ